IADAILKRKTHALALIENRQNKSLYAHSLKAYGRRYPNAGYGQLFAQWITSDSLRGYGSYGNGAAMRVSPIGFAFNSLDEVLREAKLSAEVTHNHQEAVKGAQAVASAIFLARTGKSKEYIAHFISQTFRYNLNQRLDDIRPTYKFEVSCGGSVPQA